MKNEKYLEKNENGQFRVLAGYKAFNGHVFSERDCKRYNAMADKVESFKKAGYSTINLELEQHRLFTILIRSKHVQDFA